MSTFLTFLFWISFAAAWERKPKTLSLLAAVPRIPAGNWACEYAMQVVVENVNARSDILPNYHVDVQFVDEDQDSATGNGLKQFIAFASSNNQSSIAAKSPIFIGPVTTSSCMIGTLVHHYDMVMLAMGCAASDFTANRKIYPSMYRNSISDDSQVDTFVKFVTQLGQWSKIAIISNSLNKLDFLTAIQTVKAMQAASVRIVSFNVVPAVDDATFVNLKASNVRIIFLIFSQPDLFNSLICSLYKFEMTPSEGYLFVLRGILTINEKGTTSGMPSWCKSEHIMEQLRGSFIVGVTTNPVENYQTSLGYDLTYFEERMQEITKKLLPPNFRIQQGRSYQHRYKCHDTMMQAILALDKTEKIISKANLSLSDYKSYSKIISQIANLSVAATDFVGLRVGKVVYSKRLEFDSEPHFFKQWIPGSEGAGLVVYSVKAFDNNTVDGLANRTLVKVREITWFNRNQKLPPDSWLEETVTVETPDFIFPLITSTSAVLILIQLFLTGATCRLRHNSTVVKGAPLSKVILISGFILLEIVAICQSTKYSITSTDLQCASKIALTVCGTALLNGYLFAKLALPYYKKSKLAQRITIPFRTWRQLHKSRSALRKTGQNECSQKTGLSDQQRDRLSFLMKKAAKTFSKKDEIFVISASLVFLLANCIVIAVWFHYDPVKAEISELADVPVKDYLKDTILRKYCFHCTSSKDIIWLSVIVALHAALFGNGTFFIYDLRTQLTCHSGEELHESRVALLNSLTLCVGTALILLLIQSPITGQLVIAFAALLIPASTMLIIFIPWVKALTVMPTADHLDGFQQATHAGIIAASAVAKSKCVA